MSAIVEGTGLLNQMSFVPKQIEFDSSKYKHQRPVMRAERLNDAAIALSQVFQQHGVKWGMFGGTALGIKGRSQESKDIDCLVVGLDKPSVVRVLEGQTEFKIVPIMREDVLVVLWSDTPERARGDWVTIELFVSAAQVREPQTIQISGERSQGTVCLLDEVYIFKGKLRACAYRDKHTEASDIMWLEKHYGDSLRNYRRQFNFKWAGLAMRRHPQLHYPLERIGIDVEAAKEAVKDIQLEIPPNPGVGEVQSGLLHSSTNVGEVQRSLTD